MARIEFNNVEQKMENLRGYYKGSLDPDKNPYRASELTDDEFNFISGLTLSQDSTMRCRMLRTTSWQTEIVQMD